MGLSLVVGIIPYMRERDAERTAYYQEQFTKLNHALRSAKAPEHHEPQQPASGAPASWDMGSYAMIHYVRRTAAYICLRKTLPSPGSDEAASDPINEQWRMWATTHQPKSLMSTFFGERAPVPFEHLMTHSDAGGYYLPVKMPRVIVAAESLAIAGGGLIGSTEILRDECRTIAEALALPLDLDPSSDEVAQAMERQGEAESGWQRYGRESFVCLALHRAAEASLQTGHALVFC